ncbi:MAG: amidohydrolase family protein [Flavobacteriia bacterium]
MKRIMKYLIILLIGSSFGVLAIAQQSRSILLLNGYLHVGNGEVLESALIGIKDNKISLIKNSLAYTYERSDWDTIIDLQGKHVYPGFIAPNSTLGLTEIDAVRATRDFNEVGIYNPHVRSQIAYNVESKVIATVRTNGVLMTQATPRGGDISGTSSVMALSGWNWEDATVLKDDGIHVNWPESMQGGGWWAEPEDKKRNEKYDEQKQALYNFFEMAKTYSGLDEKERNDLRLDAMITCFRGTKRVYFHANDLQQLQDIIDFTNHFDIKFPVIIGGYDSYLITRKLKDENIPVMLLRTHSLPENEEDPIDLPFRLAALLQEGGVKFCLQNEGEMEAMNARNLPFQAGTAMAYGLTEEQAVRSISLSTCEILGIDEDFGSIERGKSATLFVSEGNALDMRTNNVTLILYKGEFQDTGNFQKDLYEKYSEKYGK